MPRDIGGVKEIKLEHVCEVVGLSVPYCELFAGRSNFEDSGLVGLF